jgi:hypothetical protein
MPRCQESYDAGKEAGIAIGETKGFADGWVKCAAFCGSVCNQIAADGLPQPEADEPADPRSLTSDTE